MKKSNVNLMCLWIAFAAALLFGGTEAYAGKVTSDLPILNSSQGWGVMGENCAAHESDKEPLKLQIGDKIYSKGIGTHANSVIDVDLSGKYESFNAEIGVQKAPGTGASVIFRILVDGQEKFNSGVMTVQSPAKKISIPVAGAIEISLVVDDAGDGMNCDLANWVNVSLVKSDNAVQRANNKGIDIIPFGKVMVWNSNLQANNPSRIGELNVKDIFPGEELLPVDGQFILTPDKGGKSCIGGRWAENRRIREFVIEFAEGSKIPELAKTALQWWLGSSVWRGEWKPLSGKIEKEGNTFVYNCSVEDYRNDYWKDPAYPSNKWTIGVPKFRWVFETKEPVKVKNISAYPRAIWKEVEIELLVDKDIAKGKGSIEIYNGEIRNSSQDYSKYNGSWQLGKPLSLKLKNCTNRKPPLANRSLLNITLPKGSFSVSVADIIDNGCVYVPDYGFFATTPGSGITLESYREQIAGKKTVLQQVREMPDQTFAQAFEKVHYDHQDDSPVMLSLAGAMDKCVVQQGGALHYLRETVADRQGVGRKSIVKLTPKYGSGKNENLERHLEGGWYPVPVTTIKDQGITYQQKTFVAPHGERSAPVYYEPLKRLAICVTEIVLSNTDSQERTASVELATEQAIAAVKNGFVAGGGVLVYYDTSAAQKLKIETVDSVLKISGNMQPSESQKVVAYIPMYDYRGAGDSDDCKQLTGGKGVKGLIAETKTYWDEIMAEAIQLDIPDEQFENLVKASQVHCLIAARNEESGKYLAPWISSWLYGPLESEGQSIILGMGMMGHEQFSKQALDFFISKYNEQGYLTTGYTMFGTGQHLWTLADYYKLYRDKEWLRANASEIKRVCGWIAKQLDKTRKFDPYGNKMPEYGLFPPGVAADWARFAYRAQVQSHWSAGLKGAAECLEDINYPGYEEILETGQQFNQDVRRAFKWSTSKGPVVKLQNDTWIPYCPTFVYAFGLLDAIYPGEDWNRSWAYDAELGANHLAAAGVLEIDDPEVDVIRNTSEDILFMRDGLAGSYPAAEVAKDKFNLSGFGKCQTYYGRLTELHAAKDDIKPFIRSYFNAACSIICPEVLSLWEHTPLTRPTDAYNKTHETGWFLYQTRIMLVNERDDELWLAPFITNNWQEDGMVIDVKNAPTDYGKVSYKITSHVDKGYIDAEITSPDRFNPNYLVVRLRHPQEKKMIKVQVNGREHNNFDPDKEIVKFKLEKGKNVIVRAFYSN